MTVNKDVYTPSTGSEPGPWEIEVLHSTWPSRERHTVTNGFDFGYDCSDGSMLVNRALLYLDHTCFVASDQWNLTYNQT